MGVYRRGKTYWIDIACRDGTRIRRSARTIDRRQAQELHDKVKAETWRQGEFGERPAFTWKQAVVRWLKESHKASTEDDKHHLRWLDKHLDTITLAEITMDVIGRITEAKIATGVSNASVNRMLEVLRAILNRAHKQWEWIDKVPAIHMLPEPQRRVRWITRGEAARLIAELPEHLAEAVRFTLATGLREANVSGLEWSQVDLDRRKAWIHPDQAKTRKAIAVPLNVEAMLVLRRQQDKHPQWVFTYRGARVTRFNNHAWRNALARAGIRDFRWHDLRHTWASWHVQDGTPLHALQELGGWSSFQMVLRYAHLGAEHLSEYADAIARPRLANGTSASQLQRGADKQR